MITKIYILHSAELNIIKVICPRDAKTSAPQTYCLLSILIIFFMNSMESMNVNYKVKNTYRNRYYKCQMIGSNKLRFVAVCKNASDTFKSSSTRQSARNLLHLRLPNINPV